MSADYSLYILRCADGTLYTGISTDIARRVDEHRNGKRGAKYLRGTGPLELVYAALVGDRSAASRAEFFVKQLDRAGKQKLIAGQLALDDLL